MNGRGVAWRWVALAMVLLSAPASAQEGLLGSVHTVLDTNVSSVTTKTTDASGLVTTSGAKTVFPQLTVSADTLATPKLRLDAGGIFDVIFESPTGASSLSITRLRPYFQLRSIDPVLAPGIAYFRRDEITSGGGAASAKLTGEDYSAYLGWRPVGGPQSDFQFVRTNTFDDKRATTDSTKDFGSIISRYNYKTLGVNYLGSYVDTNNRIEGVDTLQLTNSVRVDHAVTLFSNRLNWNGSYNVNHQDLKATASGSAATVPVPVTAFAGLAAISDTPLTAQLAQNPALVDGNLAAGAGVDIGLPGFGGDIQARNVGLDLATPAAVNRLLVWVDRDLPASVAASFTWEIYSSSDNTTWSREALVTAAPFGPFETRFQIDFRTVTARYFKAVTRPLSGTVVDAARFPNIFVTEVQAFILRSAGDLRGTEARTAQLLNSDVRLRLLDAPRLYYESSYWYSGLVSGPHRDILSNGASVFHPFARIFSVQGRIAREQGNEVQGPRTAFVENASFTVTPVRTLTAALLYSGLSEEVAQRSDSRRTVFLQTNAHLYRGFDVQVGGGWTFTASDDGRNSRDGLFNTSATIVPRPNLTVSINYADTATRPTGPFSIDRVFRTRRGYLTVAYDPTRTLRLVVSEERLDATGDRPRNSHNFAVDWSPFPDGALQFIVAYNEVLRDLAFGTEKTFRPGVRWTFARQSYIDLSYQRIRSEYVYAKTDSKIFSIDLKLFL